MDEEVGHGLNAIRDGWKLSANSDTHGSLGKVTSIVQYNGGYKLLRYIDTAN